MKHLRLYLILIAILAPLSGLKGQVIEPKMPTDPAFDESTVQFDVSAQKAVGFPYRCASVTVGERTNTGVIFLLASDMTFFFEKNGKQYKNICAITNLSSIEFQRWKGYLQKDGSYIFYPIYTKITLKDDSAFNCTYYLEQFGKLEFKNLIGLTKLYSFFYEYRNSSGWQNSGKKERSYPETHPPRGCLRKLIFLQ